MRRRLVPAVCLALSTFVFACAAPPDDGASGAEIDIEQDIGGNVLDTGSTSGT